MAALWIFFSEFFVVSGEKEGTSLAVFLGVGGGGVNKFRTVLLHGGGSTVNVLLRTNTYEDGYDHNSMEVLPGKRAKRKHKSLLFLKLESVSYFSVLQY